VVRADVVRVDGFQASGFGLQASGFRLRASGFGLRASECEILRRRLGLSALPRAGLALLAAALVATTPGESRAQDVPDDLVITLQRTACFGACPAYKVSIDSAGTVTYDGSSSVRVAGRQTARVPLSSVAGLVETANRIGFFGLEDSYTAPVTDLPTTIVTVRSGGRTKRVEDYVGAPADLRAFERQIDEVAGTRRWIRIDVQTLEELVRRNAKPSRDELDTWLRDAIVYDELDVAAALLALGANPNGPVAVGAGRPLLVGAQSAAAVRLLIDAGADPLARTTDGKTLLDIAAHHPMTRDVSDALLKAGVPASQGALLGAACLGNLAVVDLLLRAGANPSIGFGDEFPLECARKSNEFFSTVSRVVRAMSLTSYEGDFDGVIAALERAAANRNER
jgi:hypothetical protein